MSIEKQSIAQIEAIVNEFLEYGIVTESNNDLYVAQKRLFRATWMLGCVESMLYSALYYCPEEFINKTVATLQQSLDNVKDSEHSYKKELDKFEEL